MSAVREIVPLPSSGPWPTIDPFLFCVHHRDGYPHGDGALAPHRPLLAGRNLGSDFSGRDGWSMYHGQRVPGFPAHPHRGFETVTYVRRGFVDHADSLGVAARYGEGDVQWLTAGRGIVHAEMFPLLAVDEPNPLDLFQIWLNLPRVDKMAEPHMALLPAGELPLLAAAEGAVVRVVAGSIDDVAPPAAPPSSWASRADTTVAIWHVMLDGPGAAWRLPTLPPGVTRTLYVCDGGPVTVRGRAGEGVEVRGGFAAIQGDDDRVIVEAVSAAEILVLQGRPIAEPVFSYGPFVMNDRQGIISAFEDYERTRFGGWPWGTDDPTHGLDPVRLLRRPAA